MTLKAAGCSWDRDVVVKGMYAEQSRMLAFFLLGLEMFVSIQINKGCAFINYYLFFLYFFDKIYGFKILQLKKKCLKQANKKNPTWFNQFSAELYPQTAVQVIIYRNVLSFCPRFVSETGLQSPDSFLFFKDIRRLIKHRHEWKEHFLSRWIFDVCRLDMVRMKEPLKAETRMK